jgi:hypothetical protein
MEVHAPESPVHTLRGFLFHLLAITAGLLIALGLEGIVTAVHHRSQVDEARAMLSAEVGTNARELQNHLQRLKGQQGSLEAMRTALRSNNPAGARGLHLNVSFADLQRASYEAAQISNTFSLMDYAEASRYAALYRKQAVFDNVQNHAVLDVEMALVGALPGPDNSLEGFETLSPPERLDLTAKLNDYRAQLLLCVAAAQELAAEYAKHGTE